MVSWQGVSEACVLVAEVELQWTKRTIVDCTLALKEKEKMASWRFCEAGRNLVRRYQDRDSREQGVSGRSSSSEKWERVGVVTQEGGVTSAARKALPSSAARGREVKVGALASRSGRVRVSDSAPRTPSPSGPSPHEHFQYLAVLPLDGTARQHTGFS